MSTSLVLLGIAVAISPSAMLSVVVMMAITGRTRTSWAFAAGWFLSIGVSCAAVMLLGKSEPSAVEHPNGLLLAILDLVLGVVLAAMAFRLWRAAVRRPDAPPPKWIGRLADMSVVPALVFGAFMPPAVIAFAAGNELAQRQMSMSARWIGVAVFALIGSLGSLIPIVYVAIRGQRADARLQIWQAWLLKRWQTLLMWLLAVVSVYMLLKGVFTLLHRL